MAKQDEDGQVKWGKLGPGVLGILLTAIGWFLVRIDQKVDQIAMIQRDVATLNVRVEHVEKTLPICYTRDEATVAWKAQGHLDSSIIHRLSTLEARP